MVTNRETVTCRRNKTGHLPHKPGWFHSKGHKSNLERSEPVSTSKHRPTVDIMNQQQSVHRYTLTGDMRRSYTQHNLEPGELPAISEQTEGEVDPQSLRATTLSIPISQDRLSSTGSSPSHSPTTPPKHKSFLYKMTLGLVRHHHHKHSEPHEKGNSSRRDTASKKPKTVKSMPNITVTESGDFLPELHRSMSEDTNQDKPEGSGSLLHHDKVVNDRYWSWYLRSNSTAWQNFNVDKEYCY